MNSHLGAPFFDMIIFMALRKELYNINIKKRKIYLHFLCIDDNNNNILDKEYVRKILYKRIVLLERLPSFIRVCR